MSEIHERISNTIFYRKMGSGPVLVLLHGFPESGTLWRYVWDTLSSQVTLIIPDLPGSGESDLNYDSGIADMAVLVKEVLDKEGIDRAVIAGHSMGGYVALAFAHQYPQAVAGLSLVHSTPLADDEEKKKVRQKAIEIINKGGKDMFLRQMVTNLFSAGFKLNDQARVEEQIANALTMNEASLVNFYTAMMQRPERTETVTRADFPVQWIFGAEDVVTPYSGNLKYCHESGVNFVSFYSGSAHMSMIEQPALLAADLERFTQYCFSR